MCDKPDDYVCLLHSCVDAHKGFLFLRVEFIDTQRELVFNYMFDTATVKHGIPNNYSLKIHFDIKCKCLYCKTHARH